MNLICGYTLGYPCIFPYVGVWLWGTLLICGIYGRGVGDEGEIYCWTQELCEHHFNFHRPEALELISRSTPRRRT
jgi:hypothetical protein